MVSFPGFPDLIDILLGLGTVACIAGGTVTSGLALVIGRARRVFGGIALILALAGGVCVVAITVKQWPEARPGRASSEFDWEVRHRLVERAAVPGAVAAVLAGVAMLLARKGPRAEG